MARRTVLKICILLFLSTKILADAPKDTFKLANEAFDRGAIDDAIQLYESIASNNYASAVLFYNLGTAYIRKENWPAARYYLEKGKLEHPTDEDLRHNLEFVREQVDDLYNFPSFPLTGLVDQIHSVSGKNSISVSLLILFGVGLLVLYTKPFHWKSIIYGIGAMWLLVLILFLFERKLERIDHSMAIVWNDQVSLYNKPETDASSSVVTLKAGLKVRTLEKIGPWCRVDLADGTSGWIQDKDVRFL